MPAAKVASRHTPTEPIPFTFGSQYHKPMNADQARGVKFSLRLCDSSGVEPKIRRISVIFVGVLDAESVWLQELESSMKSPRGTDEIAVHEKPGRLNRYPIG